MATKNTALQNAEAQAKAALWNQSGSSPSRVELLSAQNNVLAAFDLPATPFGSASNGQVNLQNTPIETEGTSAAGTGTNATSARMVSGNNSYAISDLTVGLSNAHVIVDNANIADGQTVRLVSLSVQTSANIKDPE